MERLRKPSTAESGLERVLEERVAHEVVAQHVKQVAASKHPVVQLTGTLSLRQNSSLSFTLL